MADLIWTISEDNTRHVIRLHHTSLGGRREIWVDDRLAEQGKKLFDSGSRHFLNIDGKDYELDIVTNGVTFSYYLLHNGHPIPSDEQKNKGVNPQDLIKNHYLNDLPYWHDLGNILNLSYVPNRNTAWAWRNRLIGSKQGYIVIVEKGMLQSTNQLTWNVLIHHAAPLSPEAGDKIRSDARISPLFGKVKSAKRAFVHTVDYTLISLPVNKTETASELAARIQTFISVVSMYTPPVKKDVCENQECKQPLGIENQLILINGMPRFICQKCIKEIPEYGKQAEKAYQSTPDNILPGFIVGVGIAALGAMIWTALAFLFDLIIAALAGGILMVIVRGMDQAGTKRSGRSLALAVFLTIISVTLGTFASVFIIFVRQGSPILPDTLFQAFDAMIRDTRMLMLAYFFTLLGAGPFLWSIWVQQKIFYAQAFKPEVELLPQGTIVN